MMPDLSATARAIDNAPTPQEMKVKREEIKRELASVINRHSFENGSNTPDFIIAEYLLCCLDAFNNTSRHREQWCGKELKI